MVRKGNTGKTNSTTARRAPAAVTVPLAAGPVQALKDIEDVATVGLFNTYPLQSDADPLIGGSVEDDNSDALSDVSMITNPGDFGELPDCLIVDPPDTLQEELFEDSDLWNPEVNPPAEVLPDIKTPQYNCASSSSSSSSSRASRDYQPHPSDRGDQHHHPGYLD